MSKRVAVILAGCGVYDGSEIYESVITLLRLDQRGAEVRCFAPDIPQMHVLDHRTGEEMAESRNVLTESARLARGEIEPVTALDAAQFDALIIPGGFGVAKNLSDFAVAGTDSQVQTDVLSAARSFASAGKPVGLICIAPSMATHIYGPGVTCTLGADGSDAADAITRMGAVHQDCPATDIVVDTRHKLVTTPAYMSAQSISEAASGINKLVDQILDMTL